MEQQHEINLTKEQWQTRLTLVDRARDPDDSQAWDEFTDYYASFIRMVLMQLQAPMDDLEDLSQTILVKLWQNLSTVELGRDHARFRTWLGTVIRNTFYTHCSQAASRKRREANAAVADVTAPDIEDIIESEWRKHIIALVIERLNASFSGKAMDVFTMTLDGKSVDDIASALELTKDSVYVLRNRVQSRFRKEARQLRSYLEFDQ
ncbi:MAG: sigma-70 family RNA polymerase sigma factor [Akkermansiaceae bacterium]|jgi:RNA polymerase sigma-70 factor (ECF subfamily)|nr:sigma-70 family RNA polymerase sigma factor [Akkermansiaceae bacterium]